MRFRFSWRVSLICALFILGMIRLAIWQWSRHLEKLDYLNLLSANLNSPISELTSIISKAPKQNEIIFRRLHITGTYDFEHEMILRNRRLDGTPGVFVLTPLVIEGQKARLIVNRGFIPLAYSTREKRAVFQQNNQANFVGLLKEPVQQRFMAPEDPPSGPGFAWVDAWLRVDIENIKKQLPYEVLPYFVEIMGSEDAETAEKLIVTSSSERDEMFFLAGKQITPAVVSESDLSRYPIPTFSTVVPATRHLGYVFEWSAMAFMTLLIGLILQLRRPKTG